MKPWLHKIEVIVDKAITPCIFVLLAVIILDLGFHDMVTHYELELYIQIADGFVILVFVLDLIFKYMRTRHIKDFFRKYWLDILAVFPFFLLFRFYEVTIGIFSPALTEGANTAQKLLHEGLEVEKEGAKIVREAETVAKTTRSARLARFLRPLARLPRLLKSVMHSMGFYEKPDGKHHQNEYMPKAKRI